MRHPPARLDRLAFRRTRRLPCFLAVGLSSCSPDFGVGGVLDRLGQISPKLVFFSLGYLYGGRWFDCRNLALEVLARLPGACRGAAVYVLCRLGLYLRAVLVESISDRESVGGK